MNKCIWCNDVELIALEVEINGKKQWRWVANNFEGEIYQNGKPVDVFTYADTFDNLFIRDNSI